MNNIGKTPLIRAINLEKVLGVKKIYLKIEGNNPTNSKYDRIAEVIVKTARAKGKNAIITNGNKELLKALKSICEIENTMLLVPKTGKENWKEKLLTTSQIIDLTGVKKNDIPGILLNLAKTNQALLVTDEFYEQLSIIAIEKLAEEINDRYPHEIDNIFFYSENKSELKGYQNTFLKQYLSSEDKLPNISISSKGSLEEFEDQVVSVDDELINQAMTYLQKYEHLKVKTEDGLAFAAFLKNISLNKISEGRHVIVLDRARSRVNVKRILNFDEISKQDLVNYVDNYLERYSDSLEQTLEAIEMAMKDGFILVASRSENVDGVLIIVNLGVEKFIPKYHLAYIGINPNSKGRGLGSDLIKEAINLTNGDISLHVDLDNKNAKKLYKKMGFAHVYDRMIYQK